MSTFLLLIKILNIRIHRIIFQETIPKSIVRQLKVQVCTKFQSVNPRLFLWNGRLHSRFRSPCTCCSSKCCYSLHGGERKLSLIMCTEVSETNHDDSIHTCQMHCCAVIYRKKKQEPQARHHQTNLTKTA